MFLEEHETYAKEPAPEQRSRSLDDGSTASRDDPSLQRALADSTPNMSATQAHLGNDLGTSDMEHHRICLTLTMTDWLSRVGSTPKCSIVRKSPTATSPDPVTSKCASIA